MRNTTFLNWKSPYFENGNPFQMYLYIQCILVKFCQVKYNNHMVIF